MFKALFFEAKKWILKEQFLEQGASPLSDILAALEGKTVAIVGNARSLSDTKNGAAIDDCDIVVRMHKAPLGSQASHGTKTDWLALGMPVPEQLILQRNPDILLWMAKKRKRLRFRFVQYCEFYLHAVTDWDLMAKTLKAPPSTGVMLIELVARSKAQKIHLFGFDFFQSLSLSGHRSAADVPHDFDAEKHFVDLLIKQDSRVTLNH